MMSSVYYSIFMGKFIWVGMSLLVFKTIETVQQVINLVVVYIRIVASQIAMTSSFHQATND